MPLTKEEDLYCGFGALSRVMNIGVLVTDRHGAPAFANPQALELLGCEDHGQLKRRWGELQGQLGLDPETLRGGTEPAQRIADLEVEGKGRSLRLEIYMLEEDACTGYLVLLKDRRTADVLETDLLLASQMRSVPHLYRLLAHDLKAPLNAMQLTLELLSDPQGTLPDPVREAKRQRYLAVLKEELIRLDRILLTMLGQNEPIGAKSRSFDLREILREIVALLLPQARMQRAGIDLHLPEQAAQVTGFRDRLKQALLNIAINALEAMPQGGRLGISLLREGGKLSVRCQDTGPGIPQELLSEVYGMYFTTKKTGSGIGLYVARLVAESHGGEILVENTPGQGACVTLVLPIGEKPARVQGNS